MIFRQQPIRYLLVLLVLNFPIQAQVLTGSLGITGGINYDFYNDSSGVKWSGSGKCIGLELGINLISPLEFVAGISYLTTSYSYTNDEVIYYKTTKEYEDLYIPFTLRISFWNFGFLQPNIEFGGAVSKQYSGHSQIEFHTAHSIPEDELRTDFGLLFGVGAKLNLIRYLSVAPGIHYQHNLDNDNSHHIIFSLGISYGG